MSCTSIEGVEANCQCGLTGQMGTNDPPKGGDRSPITTVHRHKGDEFWQDERSVILFISHFVFTDEGKFRIDSFQFIASSSLYGIFIASRERKQRKGKGGRAGW